MSLAAVLFDVGGVIVTDGPRMGDIAHGLGLGGDAATLDRVRAAVWGARDAYDLGSSDVEYWCAVARDCAAPPPTPQVAARLAAADAARWSRPRPEAVALVGELQASGVRLGILSNAPVPFAAGFRAQAWASAFGVLHFSCETGVSKPAPEAYLGVISALGVPAGQIAFFDDRAGNVEAAQRLGIVAQRWSGAPEARRFLARHGVDVPAQP